MIIQEPERQTVNRVSAPETPPPPVAGLNDVVPVSLDDRLREFEASWIRWALTVSRGNKSKAARLLQIKRSTLGDRIKRCGLMDQPHAVGSQQSPVGSH